MNRYWCSPDILQYIIYLCSITHLNLNWEYVAINVTNRDFRKYLAKLLKYQDSKMFSDQQCWELRIKSSSWSWWIIYNLFNVHAFDYVNIVVSESGKMGQVYYTSVQSKHILLTLSIVYSMYTMLYIIKHSLALTATNLHLGIWKWKCMACRVALDLNFWQQFSIHFLSWNVFHILMCQVWEHSKHLCSCRDTI